jgi:hypothetical protein
MPAKMYQSDHHIYTFFNHLKLLASANGYLGWGLIASGQALKMHAAGDETVSNLANGYLSYAKTLANNLMTVFYDRETNQLYSCSDWINETGTFDNSNFNKGTNCEEDKESNDPSYIGNYDEDLVAQFVYLIADWSKFGGETAREKFWEPRRQWLQSTQYKGLITVQRGIYFAAWEKIPYFFLPYFDLSIAERLFLNGERARTHFSASAPYPGLFSSVFAALPQDRFYEDLGIEVR